MLVLVQFNAKISGTRYFSRCVCPKMRLQRSVNMWYRARVVRQTELQTLFVTSCFLFTSTLIPAFRDFVGGRASARREGVLYIFNGVDHAVPRRAEVADGTGNRTTPISGRNKNIGDIFDPDVRRTATSSGAIALVKIELVAHCRPRQYGREACPRWLFTLGQTQDHRPFGDRARQAPLVMRRNGALKACLGMRHSGTWRRRR